MEPTCDLGWTQDEWGIVPVESPDVLFTQEWRMFSTTWAFHLSKEGTGLDHITHISRSLLSARKIHPDILLVVDCHRDGRKPSLG